MDQDASHDLKLKKCKWCGQDFWTPIPNKLYCCDLHRERANRYNKKMWASNNGVTVVYRWNIFK
jgi:hypothetical protein